MSSHPTTSALSLGGGIRINVELDDSGLRFDAEERYTLRYGIG